MAADYPAIEASLRHQPHEPLFTYDAPTPPEATPAFDSKPRPPLSETPVIGHTTSIITNAPSAWITSFASLPLAKHTVTTARPALSLHTASNIAVSDTSSGAQNAAPAASPNGGLTKGAMIGIIVSITVIVILAVIAIGYCILDSRQRVQYWQQKRQGKKDAETNTWETELSNGRPGRRESKTRSGLWDGLRLDNNTTQAASSNDTTRKDPILDKCERRLGSVGMWERVGGSRSEPSGTDKDDRKKDIGTKRHEKQPEWLPAYAPRDRSSIVSSVGSLGTPVVGPPIVPMHFLDWEERK